MEKLKSSITNMVLVLTGVAVITGCILAYVNHITEQPTGKGSYQLSQEDIRAGRVETFDSSSDMFQSLGI